MLLLGKHGFSSMKYIFWVWVSVLIHHTRVDRQLVKLWACLKDIKSWMTSDFLLNSDETEVIVFGPKLLRARLDHIILLDGIYLTSNPALRNLWRMFGEALSSNSHVRMLLWSTFISFKNFTHFSAFEHKFSNTQDTYFNNLVGASWI